MIVDIDKVTHILCIEIPYNIIFHVLRYYIISKKILNLNYVCNQVSKNQVNSDIFGP